MKELILRTLTGISLIILVAGSIILGTVPFLGVLILIYGLGLRELSSVGLQERSFTGILMAISAGLLLPVLFVVFQYQWNVLWFILPAAGWITGFVWSGFNRRGALILFWLAIPLSSFYYLGWEWEIRAFNSLLPLSVISLVWINDTFAYVVGSLLGKHKMTPRLSPGKTWEGFFGGIIFTVLGGLIFFRFTGQKSMVIWIIISLVIGLSGLLGDLYESGLKRKMSVKNMGGLLPGHGGILDRFDSLLFAAPATFILMLLIRLCQ